MAMTANQALKLAAELETKADDLYPCEANLSAHAALMGRVENLRHYAAGCIAYRCRR